MWPCPLLGPPLGKIRKYSGFWNFCPAEGGDTILGATGPCPLPTAPRSVGCDSHSIVPQPLIQIYGSSSELKHRLLEPYGAFWGSGTSCLHLEGPGPSYETQCSHTLLRSVTWLDLSHPEPYAGVGGVHADLGSVSGSIPLRMLRLGLLAPDPASVQSRQGGEFTMEFTATQGWGGGPHK